MPINIANKMKDRDYDDVDDVEDEDRWLEITDGWIE